MGSVVVLGEGVRVSAFALGGATVTPADDGDAVRLAWEGLADDVTLVVLTAQAASFLPDARARDGVLCVVMPS